MTVKYDSYHYLRACVRACVRACMLPSILWNLGGTFVRDGVGVTSGLCLPGSDIYDKNPLFLINATGKSATPTIYIYFNVESLILIKCVVV